MTARERDFLLEGQRDDIVLPRSINMMAKL